MDIMLDLETMGTGPDAAIIAIGAVAFDLERGIVHDNTFYHVVDFQSSMDSGCSITPSTVMWWMQQGDAARGAFARKGVHLVEALYDFSNWASEFATVVLWGNGASFDNVILRSAYELCHLDAPWKFWNDRCFRTMKALLPKPELPASSGTAHNALDDARNQALYLVEAWRQR